MRRAGSSGGEDRANRFPASAVAEYGVPIRQGIVRRDGTLQSATGGKLAIDGLWALEFGSGAANNGSTDTLFFSAGPNGEADGLFGTIKRHRQQRRLARPLRPHVTGNVQAQGTSGFRLGNSTVGGNLQLQNNAGSPNVVSGNTIGGNLQCQNNGPVTSSGNTVHGNAQGQCAAP